MTQARQTRPLDSLPPSAKFVHYVLEHDPDRTQVQLAEETGLSPRTIRNAVSELKTAGVLEESVCLRDARKRVYSLTDD
jgi:DNA-binding MarR family transcriptional regulator